MAVTLSLTITQNSQNQTNNTSNVTVKAIAKWGGGSWSHTGDCWCDLTIDGVAQTRLTNIKLNPNRTTTGSQVVYEKTLNITHNADGSKTLNCSAKFNTDLDSSGIQSASASKALTKIPRLSTFSVPSGTLGTASTITISKALSTHTNTLTYTCGSASGTIATKTDGSSVSFTFPISLASQNKTGTSVSITVKCETFNGSTSLGSSTKTVTYQIPSSVKPSLSLSMSDRSGAYSAYGGVIQNLSLLTITSNVNTTNMHGSTIAGYRLEVGNKAYINANGVFKLDTFTESGEVTLKVIATDTRGRKDEKTLTYNVIAYKIPTIISLTVHRSNSDGTSNDKGEYVKAVFSYEVSEVTGNCWSQLRYKKTIETAYTTVDLNLNDDFTVTGGSYVFLADEQSTYDVELLVFDNEHDTVDTATSRKTQASTAFTLLHFGADGTSFGVGGFPQESNLFDVHLNANFNGNVYGNVRGLNTLPKIPQNSNFNDYIQIGCWAVYGNADAETNTNMPIQVAGELETYAATGEGIRTTEWSYLRQRFIPYLTTYPIYERDITRNTSNQWTYGAWVATTLSKDVSDTVYGLDDTLFLINSSILNLSAGNTVLWSGASYMTASQSITLSKGVSTMPNGIVLTFSRYSSGTAQDYNFNHFFIPKKFVELMPGKGTSFSMVTENFGTVATKYLYISDTTITGNDNNTKTGTGSGITYVNNGYVLRYVIGV